MQTKLAGILPEQNGFESPQSLATKCAPSSLSGFVGIDKPKAVLMALAKAPRPCNLLFVGPPGSGKTTAAIAYAHDINAGLIHVPSAELTVDKVAELWDRVQYYPQSGGFWVVVCDEADRMSKQAQIALLSKLDSTANLKPVFGGGQVQGAAMPVIWIFTCNGTGADEITPPESLEKRFLSRCMTLAFCRLGVSQLATYLSEVWTYETDAESVPDFAAIAYECGGLVRDALQRLDMELLVRNSN